jgi:2-dehydro-3-deoxyphosphooctonate aldolase (KDO 8-P synthase)
MISIGKFKLGGNKPVLFAGPCLAESSQLCIDVAETIAEICKKLKFHYVFKASFEKANRTSIDSPHQVVSFENISATFKQIQKLNIPVLTVVLVEFLCFLV